MGYFDLWVIYMQSKTEGKRGPRRCRISWLQSLGKWFCKTPIELVRLAVNKVEITMLVANNRRRIGP